MSSERDTLQSASVSHETEDKQESNNKKENPLPESNNTKDQPSPPEMKEESNSQPEEKEKKEKKHKKKDRVKVEEERKAYEMPGDVRVAVIGNVDSVRTLSLSLSDCPIRRHSASEPKQGKSTMIGVLTSGTLDDGRGSARSRILRHSHERSNGRTSCFVFFSFLFSPKEISQETFCEFSKKKGKERKVRHRT